MATQLYTILSVLTAFIVTFGLTPVQLQEQPVDQASTSNVNGQSQIRENFKSLFNSIAKNDTEMSQSYQKILKEEVAKEQKTLDTMKEELQIAQNRNAWKKQNFYRGVNINQDLMLKKRESTDNNHNTDDDSPYDTNKCLSDWATSEEHEQPNE